MLDVALRLEKLLQKVPGVEVILTRRTDDSSRCRSGRRSPTAKAPTCSCRFTPTPARSAQARGIETYFLNFANNLSAAAVAARENAASAQAMGALPDFVKAIALNNKLDESRDFAHARAARDGRAAADGEQDAEGPRREAGAVRRADRRAMPSVLAEISFVTNPQEAKLLKANAYRQRIAEALFNAIRKYQTSLKNVETVAQQ